MAQMPRTLIAADWLLRIFGLFFCLQISVLFVIDPDHRAFGVLAWIVTAFFFGLTIYRWKHFKTWRNDPPSEPQMEYARDLGIHFHPKITKGELSDLISAVKKNEGVASKEPRKRTKKSNDALG
jgi:hypothetical protein